MRPVPFVVVLAMGVGCDSAAQPGGSACGAGTHSEGGECVTDADTAATGETGSDTAPDTSDTVDTGADTSDTGDTADTADTAADPADTAETGLDTSDTGDTAVDPDKCVDTVTPTNCTAASGAPMIYLTGGTFSMGSGLGDPDAAYIDHEVTLTHDFYLAQTETTRGEWESDPTNTSWRYQSLPSYPCTGATADCPADTMTWYDAAMYANWLSVEEGLTECYLADGTDMAAAYLADPYTCPGYRLPTEAEWEYAARAGVDTTYSGSNTAADVAWTYENSYPMGTFAHEACSLAANAWGLCDMSGNVYEWSNDGYDSAHGGYASGVATTDPSGPSAGSYRVIRGGFWYSTPSGARVAYRDKGPPANAGSYVGFRLARSIP